MTDEGDAVFKALADPTRRRLLDRLFAQDGLTLTELEAEMEMTRFGVMKHLRILEEANLVITRRAGRHKHHFLNVVPLPHRHVSLRPILTRGPTTGAGWISWPSRNSQLPLWRLNIARSWWR